MWPRCGAVATTLGVVAGCAEVVCPFGQVPGDGTLCVPADIPSSPQVQGERSAGHSNPIWLWEPEQLASFYEVRCMQCGVDDWTSTVDTMWRATGLSEGDYVFEIRACSDAGCSSEAQAVTTVEFITPYAGYSGYWQGVGKSITRSPTGHVTAIVAHNAYTDDFPSASDNLSETLTKIDLALADGADVIELDVKSVGGEIFVDHDDTNAESRARLENVLDHAPLAAADAILYIELKEQRDFDDVAIGVLRILNDRRDSYANNGRPVIVRSFDDARIDALTKIATAASDYPLIEHYVRTQLILGQSTCASVAGCQAGIDQAAVNRFGGVALFYTIPSLLTSVAYAKSQGLGVNLGTLNFLSSHVALREIADALNTNKTIEEAKVYVSLPDSYLHFDASSQDLSSGTMSYLRDGTSLTTLVSGAGLPAPAMGLAGEALYGSYLRFAASASQRLSFHDADAPQGSGYLVSAYVRFDDLSIAEDESQVIVGKAEQGAFALDLDRKVGRAAMLRFYVWLNGEYKIASYPAANLVQGRSYLITGFYDGSGDVWLMVDNSPDRTTRPGYQSGGVVNNDVNITIGADPMAGGGHRDYFTGAVQMVTVTSYEELLGS